MRAELVSVGTELLLGQIVDTNSAYLAGRLAMLGIDCLHMSTVGDNLGRATAAFRVGLGRSDLVVATGGLGPTEDDLTREAIAAALGETPAVDPALEAELAGWFAGRGLRMPPTNRKQAWLIPSARALANPNGTAPGWDVRRDGRRIVAMPGVPREMTAMWESLVEPTLVADGALRSRTLKLLGIGESAVEEALGELVRSTAPTVATYAKNDGVHVRITDKGGGADARVGEMETRIRERLGEHIWGTDTDGLGSALARELTERGWRLATAEALSGGELARVLVETGIGDRLAGGVVRPGADAETLFAAIDPLGAEVRIAVPDGEAEPRVLLRSPSRDRQATVRARSLPEARRRAVLAALDLALRVLRSREAAGS